MKRTLFLFLLTAVSTFAFAQGEFSFEKENHDFGTIIEGIQATHVFKFKNTGDAPIVMTAVKASCGCTTPVWPKEPIPPGGSGEIKAIYNSKNRIGTFNKSIRITSNAKSPTRTVYIKGVVEKEPPRVYTEAEKAVSPRLNLEKSSYAFGKIETGQRVNKSMNITNTGKQNLMIERISSTCNCVILTNGADLQAIPPGGSAQLDFTYSPRSVGKKADMVFIHTNDIVNAKGQIVFNSDVVESLNNNGVMKQNNSNVPFK